MKKTSILVASSLSILLTPSVFADVQFKKAGYSIGTVHDEHIEFFDRDNDQFLDAITYGADRASIFNGRENGYNIASLEAFSSNGLHSSKYISVADMNGDGFQDLITYPFRILINNKKGHFPNVPNRHPFEFGGDYFKIQTADIDQNGTIDLFLTGSQRANGLHYGETVTFMNVTYDPSAANRGYFTYQTKVQYSQDLPPLKGNISSMKPNGVSIGDLNNDGMPDVIFINSAKGQLQTSTSSVTINNGSGTMIYKQALSDAEDIALGDLDNDGDLDIYLARSGNQPDEVWFNNGNGLFTNSGQSLGYDDSISTAMADLDGDGDLDIVTTNHNTTQNAPHRIWINNGSGQFTLSSFRFGANHKTETLKLLDLDRDGDIDIVTLGGRGFHPQQSSILLSTNEVWLNQLISNDYSFDLDAALTECKNNPNDYGLYSQSQMDEALISGLSEGVLACQSDPHNFGLFDQSDLNNEFQAGISQGEQNCKDNPVTCNLFDQNDLDQAILYGLSDGQTSGIIMGKQFCINDPNACGLFNESAIEEAEANGQEIGEITGAMNGKQACIDDPSSCGLYDQSALNEAKTIGLETGYVDGKQSCIENPDSCGLYGEEELDQNVNDLIYQIIRELPKGQLKSICKKNPYFPFCQQKSHNLKHIIKHIIKDLSKDQHKSICNKNPDSVLCHKKHHHDNYHDWNITIKQLIKDLPKEQLNHVCKKHPDSPLCE